MGLDIYVGTLTRYHAGAWKTIVQQTMESRGVSYHMTRANAPSDAVTDPKVVEKAVRGWQRAIASAVGSQTRDAFDWSEGMTPPYFTDKPDWDGYGAVILTAAYSAIDREPPRGLPDEWQSDQTITEARSRKAYRQILEPEWWFPISDDALFACATVAGSQVVVGSSLHLRDQLKTLNAATLNGSDADLVRWRREGPPDPPGQDLQHATRFGLAILIEMSTQAVEHRLPMLLDY